MASTYSTELKLELMATGENASAEYEVISIAGGI